MTTSQELAGLRTVGILGGVGSGKSSVARALAAALPAEVLDADEAVSRLLADPGILREIEEALGPGLTGPAGELDRTALAARIFQDQAARTRLEAVLHPAVRRQFHDRLTALEATGRPVWVVLDVPLLLERGLHGLCDYLVFVRAPARIRAERARTRHGWTEAEWQQREAAQLPLEEKEAAADAILDNGGSPEELPGRILGILEPIRELPPWPLRERWPAWNQLPLR